MKGLSVLVLLFLFGCASGPTLEQLEAQAFLTGDWTEVEKRQRMILRTGMQPSLQCPAGHTGFCVDNLASIECSCIESRVMRTLYTAH